MAVALGLSLLACNNQQPTTNNCPQSDEQTAEAELKKAEEEMKIDFGLQKKTLTIRDDILLLTANCAAPVDIKTICEKKELTCATLYAKNYKESGLLPNGTFQVRYALLSDTLIELQVVDKSNKVLSILNQISFEPEFSKIPTPVTQTFTPDYNCIPACMERLRPAFAYFQNMANVNCQNVSRCFACRCSDGTTAYVMMLFRPLRPHRCYQTEIAQMITDRTLIGGGKGKSSTP